MRLVIPEIVALSEQNASMREALDVIRENEFLRESLAAKGVPIAEPLQTKAAIVALVAARYSLSISELLGPGRARYVAWPRQEAMWIMRQIRMSNGRRKYSLPQIGEVFSGLDHTTVRHGIRAHEARSLAQQEAA